MKKLEDYTLEEFGVIRQAYQEHINNCDTAMKRGAFGVDDYKELVPTLIGITRDVLPFLESAQDFLERQKITSDLAVIQARQQAEAYAAQVAQEQAARQQQVHEVCQLIQEETPQEQPKTKSRKK